MKNSILFFLLCFFGQNALAEVFTDGSVKYDAKVIDDTLVDPWAVVAGPNQDLYITEKSGKIHIYREGKRVASLTGIPSEIAVVGQGGLLDMAFHPDFSENHFVYLSYTTRENAKPVNGVNTRVSRFKLMNNQLQDKKVLVQGAYGTDGAHFGSRLVFGKDKKLYASFGERHNKEKAQSLKYLNGKIIRINDDGSIPEDNPFVNTRDARKEIFTYGHRNPQGIDMNPSNFSIVVSEHGPSGYDASLPTNPRVGKADEINILKKGANYGWPLVFGSPEVLTWTEEMHEIVKEKKLQMPLKEYSIPDGIAPSGIAFYTGDKIPQWKNSLFVACLRGYVMRLEIDKENKLVKEEKILSRGFPRTRDVANGSDGYLYVITSVGQLVRLEP